MATFETFNDMVRDLHLDRGNWVNAEATHFLKKSVYDHTPQNVVYCPSWLSELRFTCTNGHLFSPDWLAKRHGLSSETETAVGTLTGALAALAKAATTG